MHERTIRDLNELIRRQEAMVESYARLAHDVKDDELRENFKVFQENHFKQMMVISDRVMELGGEPKFKVGLRGVMDDLRHRRGKKDITDLETAKIAISGEKTDIEKIESYNLGEVDATSLEIIQKLIERDEENIKALEAFIQRFEIQ
ncbi:MAG: PA2169 family four-helix-bundle protein [Clostridia bacterium]|nr:PA2169 family four-helix-bundle protein [Clostridia bacterium]